MGVGTIFWRSDLDERGPISIYIDIENVLTENITNCPNVPDKYPWSAICQHFLLLSKYHYSGQYCKMGRQWSPNCCQLFIILICTVNFSFTNHPPPPLTYVTHLIILIHKRLPLSWCWSFLLLLLFVFCLYYNLAFPYNLEYYPSAIFK
jgi:hypothetical protein